jgi:hypothetical protein
MPDEKPRLECGHPIEGDQVWCPECGTHRRVDIRRIPDSDDFTEDERVGIQCALDAISDVPPYVSDMCDRPFEAGHAEGVAAAYAAVAELLKPEKANG